jgi:hypothetical protein
VVTVFFDGLDLVEPGVIRCPEWRPERREDAAGKYHHVGRNGEEGRSSA